TRGATDGGKLARSCSLGSYADHPHDRGAVARSGANGELATDRSEPIGHPLQAGSVAGGCRIESATVVVHLEAELAAPVRDADRGRARPGVLRNVVERLERAEVDRRLDLLREPADRVGFDRDREGRLPCLRLERGGESLVR